MSKNKNKFKKGPAKGMNKFQMSGLIKEIFEKEDIKMSYHAYKQPRYRQKGKIFLEHLSVLDLLFSELENSKKFIWDRYMRYCRFWK